MLPTLDGGSEDVGECAQFAAVAGHDLGYGGLVPGEVRVDGVCRVERDDEARCYDARNVRNGVVAKRAVHDIVHVRQEVSGQRDEGGWRRG